MTVALTCPAGRPIPERYVRAAIRSNATRPLRTVAAALRDYDLDDARTVPEIAAAYGIPDRTFHYLVKRTGLPFRGTANRGLPDDELQRTVRLVDELGSQEAAGRVLGLHQTTVGDRLAAAGHRPTRSEAAA